MFKRACIVIGLCVLATSAWQLGRHSHEEGMMVCGKDGNLNMQNITFENVRLPNDRFHQAIEDFALVLCSDGTRA